MPPTSLDQWTAVAQIAGRNLAIVGFVNFVAERPPLDRLGVGRDLMAWRVVMRSAM